MRTIGSASMASQRHFIESFSAYLEAVIQQASDRDEHTRHSIESYLKIRRENIGLRPTLSILEMDMNIPDEAFYHPTIVQLSYYIAELIILDNVSLTASYYKRPLNPDKCG